MKKVISLFAAFLLAGCIEQNPYKELASCQMEGMKLYPTVNPSVIDAFAQTPIHQFIAVCMRAKGYRMTLASQNCVTGVNFTLQAACYRADNWWSNLWQEIKATK